MNEHTPTPWFTNTDLPYGGKPRIYQGVDGRGKLVCEVGNAEPAYETQDEWEANAALIVTAVNAYEPNQARIEALEAEVERLREEFVEAYRAFTGAFDTPVSRRRQNDEYAADARRRMNDFAERFIGDRAALEASHD